MADIVNLRTARKRKVRAEKATEAAERRVQFGETRAARETRRDNRNDADARLDGHKREP
ncbi:DUF4169 family protein [Acuticoccus sp. MNP-M23]|uniref:DUF4169 family protein n=1 Tax=Acuticoccus sp. MNP-M23 TaxID=3072793 RepID=UPI002815C852|nr:DUF4169 family protein [Acuticoccus sp. MNP-M23]WMS42670.1 DUF4169 family protein [Acuticoccus sp. MNP-M23]